MGSFWGFMFRQFTDKPKQLPQHVKLQGKTALVTGASGGLGLEAAKELVAHGLTRIILAVRDSTKADSARKILLGSNADVDVQVWDLDQESYQSMKALADRAASLDRLDIVILNAGVKKIKYEKSAHGGHESNVQVNHLGTSFLSLLLLDPLNKTAVATGNPTRLTIVSSENHFWVDFKVAKASGIIETFDREDTFGKGMEQYNKSKLLNVLWVQQLSNKVNANHVIINVVNPGFCKSELHRHDPGATQFVKMVGWTAAQGGYCLADAATRHDGGGSGIYVSEQKAKK
jgi:retinol dehydrogenase-12